MAAALAVEEGAGCARVHFPKAWIVELARVAVVVALTFVETMLLERLGPRSPSIALPAALSAVVDDRTTSSSPSVLPNRFELSNCARI